MGPVKALFDTNILIDYRNGVVAARDEIARYPRPSISLITWMEVLLGTPPDQGPPVRGFFGASSVSGSIPPSPSAPSSCGKPST
jgi:hypothetical protein